MIIAIDKVISFYDSKEHEDGKDASGITGLLGEDLGAALIIHFLESKGYTCSILNDTPTEGHKKGKWLDRWIVARRGEEKILYQIEIKNWSSHSIGGIQLKLEASNEEIMQVAKLRHTQEWDEALKQFKNHYVGKVLRKMKYPKELEDKNIIIEPIICFWYPIADSKASQPIEFYNLECIGEFKKINFFSMSIYLRNLWNRGIEKIEINTPKVDRRLKKITSMFSHT